MDGLLNNPVFAACLVQAMQNSGLSLPNMFQQLPGPGNPVAQNTSSPHTDQTGAQNPGISFSPQLTPGLSRAQNAVAGATPRRG